MNPLQGSTRLFITQHSDVQFGIELYVPKRHSGPTDGTYAARDTLDIVRLILFFSVRLFLLISVHITVAKYIALTKVHGS